MPPLVLFAIVGIGCYAGYRLASKLIEQAQTPGREETDRLRRERAAAAERRETLNLGELEWDEHSGVYRPRTHRRG